MDYLKENPNVAVTALAFASVVLTGYMIFQILQKKDQPSPPPKQDIKKTSDDDKEKSPEEKWNRPSRAPPEASRKPPKRDVKDFAMDFDLTESTMNQAFAMSPKLKSRGMKSKGNKSGMKSSGFKSYDSGYVLEELSPDTPSERHLVSPTNKKDK